MKKFLLNVGMSESMLRKKGMVDILPSIAESLEQRNAIAIMMEAHEHRLVSDRDYEGFIRNMANEINGGI